MIASLGVIIGTTALFIILSGFSGLRTFSYSLLDISDPDIKVSPVKGKSFLLSEGLESKIKGQEGVAFYSKVIEERAFLKNGDKQQVAYVKGVDQNYRNIVKLDSALQMGKWFDSKYTNTSIIGDGLAYKLSVGVLNFGESLQILVPKTNSSFLNPNSMRTINTQVIGIYTGTEEFSNKYVFVSNKQAQKLLNYKSNQFSTIEIKLQSDINPDTFAEALQTAIGSQYKVQTKAQLNELFYKVINTENFVSYLIFTLIVIVAMFNVIGAIIMMIIDKKQNIETLVNLGATVKEVKRIFMFQGTLLTAIGMIIGLLLAYGLILAQQKNEFFMITSNIAYPVELRFTNLMIVILTILILGILAAKIASSRISAKFIEN